MIRFLVIIFNLVLIASCIKFTFKILDYNIILLYTIPSAHCLVYAVLCGLISTYLRLIRNCYLDSEKKGFFCTFFTSFFICLFVTVLINYFNLPQLVLNIILLPYLCGPYSFRELISIIFNWVSFLISDKHTIEGSSDFTNFNISIKPYVLSNSNANLPLGNSSSDSESGYSSDDSSENINPLNYTSLIFSHQIPSAEYVNAALDKTRNAFNEQRYIPVFLDSCLRSGHLSREEYDHYRSLCDPFDSKVERWNVKMSGLIDILGEMIRQNNSPYISLSESQVSTLLSLNAQPSNRHNELISECASSERFPNTYVLQLVKYGINKYNSKAINRSSQIQSMVRDINPNWADRD